MMLLSNSASIDVNQCAARPKLQYFVACGRSRLRSTRAAARLPRGYRAALRGVFEKEVNMAKSSEIRPMALSRRTIVTRGVAGAAGAAVLLGLVSEASAKMAQKAAEYQNAPKGDQECSNCSLFQEPNACTLIDGEISPKGWCKFWVKKQG